MAHFSRGTQVFKQPIEQNKEYRITAWINMKTPWNDSLGRYEQMSDRQKQDCERLFQEMQKYGAQLSVTISERTDAIDVREFPVAGRTTLFVNNKQQNQAAQQYDQSPGQYQQSNSMDADDVSTGFE